MFILKSYMPSKTVKITQSCSTNFLTAPKLAREYQSAYRRLPETKLEVDAAQAPAVEILSAVEW